MIELQAPVDTQGTAMFYHFLAHEGGHPTWEEHFIEKYSKCKVLFLSHACQLNQQKQ